MRVSFLGRNDGKYPAFQSHPVFSRTKRKRNLHLLLDITHLSRPRKSAAKASTDRGKNGIIHAMKPHAKTALSLALAVVGGIAAGLRCDASEWVENSSQYTPRPAAYTEGSDPFVPLTIQMWKDRCDKVMMLIASSFRRCISAGMILVSKRGCYGCARSGCKS